MEEDKKGKNILSLVTSKEQEEKDKGSIYTIYYADGSTEEIVASAVDPDHPTILYFLDRVSDTDYSLSTIVNIQQVKRISRRDA